MLGARVYFFETSNSDDKHLAFLKAYGNRSFRSVFGISGAIHCEFVLPRAIICKFDFKLKYAYVGIAGYLRENAKMSEIKLSSWKQISRTSQV